MGRRRGAKWPSQSGTPQLGQTDRPQGRIGARQRITAHRIAEDHRRDLTSTQFYPWPRGRLWRRQETLSSPGAGWRAAAEPEQIPSFSSRSPPGRAPFDDHRRLHASPIAIITKRLEKLHIALVLWVFQATTDPDLGVVKRALGLIILGPHCPQMRFDKNAIRDVVRPGWGSVGSRASVSSRPTRFRFGFPC